jgi:hypothetical protein
MDRTNYNQKNVTGHKPVPKDDSGLSRTEALEKAFGKGKHPEGYVDAGNGLNVKKEDKS